MLKIEDCVSKNVLDKFEFHDYGHALDILTQSYPDEWREIVECFEKFSFSQSDITASGGNKSSIPKKFDDLLFPYDWKEIRITGDLLIRMYQRNQSASSGRGSFGKEPFESGQLKDLLMGTTLTL